MATLLWRKWQDRYRQKKIQAMLAKRVKIGKQGITVYADVMDCYDTGLSASGYSLLRIKLRIPLLDDHYLYPVSSTFSLTTCTRLKGMRVKVQFLPGDLSQVIICY